MNVISWLKGIYDHTATDSLARTVYHSVHFHKYRFFSYVLLEFVHKIMEIMQSKAVKKGLLIQTLE